MEERPVMSENGRT